MGGTTGCNLVNATLAWGVVKLSDSCLMIQPRPCDGLITSRGVSFKARISLITNELLELARNICNQVFGSRITYSYNAYLIK